MSREPDGEQLSHGQSDQERTGCDFLLPIFPCSIWIMVELTVTVVAAVTEDGGVLRRHRMSFLLRSSSRTVLEVSERKEGRE